MVLKMDYVLSVFLFVFYFLFILFYFIFFLCCKIAVVCQLHIALICMDIFVSLCSVCVAACVQLLLQFVVIYEAKNNEF